MNQKEREINKEFDILLYIYKETVIDEEDVYFTKICENSAYKKIEVSSYLDHLYDQGMIDAEWKEMKDGCSAYCYSVDDGFMGFTKGLYNATKKAKRKECIKKSQKEKVLKLFEESEQIEQKREKGFK